MRAEWKYLYCKALQATGNHEVLRAIGPRLRETAEHFTLYIVYQLDPMLEAKREEGELTPGQTKTIKIDGEPYQYTGEVDRQGKACGVGYAKKNGSNASYRGTFFNDLPEGICTCQGLRHQDNKSEQ